jgi:hypothetical protein
LAGDLTVGEISAVRRPLSCVAARWDLSDAEARLSVSCVFTGYRSGVRVAFKRSDLKMISKIFFQKM